MSSILITGFQAFDGRSINGAETLAAALEGDTIAQQSVEVQRLKVSWQSVDNFARNCLKLTTASCVVALGEANRSHISIETRGTAICTGADVDGQPAPSLPPKESSGEATTTRTLTDAQTDRARMVALKELCDRSCGALSQKDSAKSELPGVSDLQIRISEDAGEYLCNRLLFLGLEHCPVPMIFVHVPIQAEQSNDAYLKRHLPAIRHIIQTFANPVNTVS